MSVLRKPPVLAGVLPIIVAVGTLGSAQAFPPPPPVLAPTLVRPSAGTVHRYDVGSSGTTFSWDQGPVLRTLGGPPYPSIFLQCLSRVGDPACSTATATSSDLAGSLASVPVRNPANQSIVAYRYAPLTMVPDTHLDQPIQWQVASCRTSADSTCVQSAPRAL